MLDLDKRLTLPDCPDVSVFGDHERELVYYLLHQAPTLELDDNGNPEARLLLYLKRQGDQKVPTGGQISLTTILATPPVELDRIKRAIETSLATRSRATGPPPVVQLTAPEWASGMVTIVLAPSLKLSGVPSLFGDNRCALMTALTAEQAVALREQWGRKLRDAYIAYDMVVRVASTMSATTVVRDNTTVQSSNGLFDRAHVIDVTAHGVSASMHPVALKGPLWTAGLERRLTEIDLAS